MVSHVWLCSFTRLVLAPSSFILQHILFTPEYQVPESKVVQLMYKQTSEEKISPMHPKNETIKPIITDQLLLPVNADVRLPHLPA